MEVVNSNGLWYLCALCLGQKNETIPVFNVAVSELAFHIPSYGKTTYVMFNVALHISNHTI